MRMTMPQIIMLNHASSVNYKRMENRSKIKTNKQTTRDINDPIVKDGKRISELSEREKDDYYMKWD